MHKIISIKSEEDWEVADPKHKSNGALVIGGVWVHWYALAVAKAHDTEFTLLLPVEEYLKELTKFLKDSANGAIFSHKEQMIVSGDMFEAKSLPNGHVEITVWNHSERKNETLLMMRDDVLQLRQDLLSLWLKRVAETFVAEAEIQDLESFTFEEAV